MKRRLRRIAAFVVLLGAVVAPRETRAVNLVPNGGFESITSCPTSFGQLSLAAVALGLGSCNIAAIYDGEMNALLGVDGGEESVLYMCCVGVPR